MGIGVIVAFPYLCVGASLLATAGVIVAVAAALIGAAVLARHRLIYDISVIYTALTQKQWWNEITDDLIVGAIPLVQHVPMLKEQGVTHVVTLLDDFELEQGLLNPATPELWKKYGIERLHVKTADFRGVPPQTIGKVLQHIRTVRETNPKAKFYIHCKAGRGRSAAIAVADRAMHELRTQPVSVGTAQLVDQTIQELKRKRPRINLNAGQRATVIQFINGITPSVNASQFGRQVTNNAPKMVK
jgi:atypical dual specificity phosphatase